MQRTKINTLRCRLEINGTVYNVKPLPAPEGVKLYSFRKWDDAVYTVAQDEQGFIDCDCGDHTFRRAQVDICACKHGRALVALGMFRRPPLLEMRSTKR